MYNPLSLYIGLRYFRAKRRNQFISFISLISLLGMVLGVVALVVVLSVMNGFEQELRNRILAVVPHGFVNGSGNRLEDWPKVIEDVQARNYVLAAAPYIDGNIMLSRPGLVRGAQLHAIDPDYEVKVSSIDKKMLAGSLNELRAGAFNMVIGSQLSRSLGLYVGDEITVILPRVTPTPLGLFPIRKRFHISGVFQVGAELDSTTVFIHLKDGQKLFQKGDTVKGLRLQFDDLFMSANYLTALLPKLPEGVTVRDWTQTQGTLFQAVRMEKTMITLLLMVIVAIAAFNIVSILTMMVSDKRSDIAVLRTMGATPNTIVSIFVIQGISVGVSGVLLGIFIGVPLALYIGDIVLWIESQFDAHIFDPAVYYTTHIPSVLKGGDIIKIAICGFILSALATIIPSLRAAKIQPAEALRYQ